MLMMLMGLVGLPFETKSVSMVDTSSATCHRLQYWLYGDVAVIYFAIKVNLLVIESVWSFAGVLVGLGGLAGEAWVVHQSRPSPSWLLPLIRGILHRMHFAYHTFVYWSLIYFQNCTIR